MKDEIMEFLEMLESDLELTKKVGGVYDEKVPYFASHNDMMKNYIDDLKDILKDWED